MSDCAKKDFGLVRLEVSKSANEVRIWACNPKTGENVFRLKANGNVYAARIEDIIVTPVIGSVKLAKV